MKSWETTPEEPTRTATWTIGDDAKVRQARETDRYSVLPEGARQDDWTRAVAPLAAPERFADNLGHQTRNDPLARIRYVLASRCAGMTLQATAEQAVQGIIEPDAPEECVEAARQFTTHADGNDLLQGSIDGAYTLRVLASYLHRTGEARKATRKNWVLNLSQGAGLGTTRTPGAPRAGTKPVRENDRDPEPAFPARPEVGRIHPGGRNAARWTVGPYPPEP